MHTLTSTKLLTPLLWLPILLFPLPILTSPPPAQPPSQPTTTTNTTHNLPDPLPQPPTLHFAFTPPQPGPPIPLSILSIYMAAFNGLYTLSLLPLTTSLPSQGISRDDLNASTVIEMVVPGGGERRVDASIWAYENIITKLPELQRSGGAGGVVNGGEGVGGMVSGSGDDGTGTIPSTSWWLGTTSSQPILRGEIAYDEFFSGKKTTVNDENNVFPLKSDTTSSGVYVSRLRHRRRALTTTTSTTIQNPNPELTYKFTYPSQSRPINFHAFMSCAVKIYKRVAVSNSVGSVPQNRAFTVPNSPSKIPGQTTLTIAFRHGGGGGGARPVTWTQLATTLYEMRDFLREEGRWKECRGEMRDRGGRVVLVVEARLYGGGVEGESGEGGVGVGEG